MVDTSGLDDHQQELLEMRQKLDAAIKLIRQAETIAETEAAAKARDGDDPSRTTLAALQMYRLAVESLRPLTRAVQVSYHLHGRTYMALQGKPMPEQS